MYARRKDKNQPELEKFLKDQGIIFFDASAVGDGFPDLVLGVSGITITLDPSEDIEYIKDRLKIWLEDHNVNAVIHDGANILAEIKDGNKPPSKRKLTRAQKRWHSIWVGQKEVVKNINELKAILWK